MAFSVLQSYDVSREKMFGFAFLAHHQLHEVLFSFLPTAHILELRSVHSVFADLVPQYAGSQLQDVMGQPPEALPPVDLGYCLYDATHRTMDSALVRLLISCDKDLDNVLSQGPCSPLSLGEPLFTGDSSKALNILCKSVTPNLVQTLQLIDLSFTTGTVTDDTVADLLRHATSLRILVLRATSLTDASISIVASNCPLLEVLHIHGSDAITDASIQQVALSCPQLESLSVSGTGKITDESIKLIATNCAHLHSLGVGYARGLISDESIELIAEKCTKLRVLHCGGYPLHH